MKNKNTITRTFGTTLTPHQLNAAIRLGALLHGGEISFCGKPGVDDKLLITSSELTGPFSVTYGSDSVEFEFAKTDHQMFACIRVLLDENLMFEVPVQLRVQQAAEIHRFDRVSA